MNHHPKITFLIPYFGRLPAGFGFFLDGVRRNANLQFVIIADFAAPPNLPPNVRWVRRTLDELLADFRHQLGFACTLPRAYKLCDYKPLYGVLFSELLAGSDYWGFCDFDLVLAQPQQELFELIDGGHDIISFKKLWLSGSFAVLRNCERVNQLFREIEGWRRILTDRHHSWSMDECVTRYDEHVRAGSLDAVHLEPLCFTTIIWQRHRAGQFKVRFVDRAKEGLAADEVLTVNRLAGTITSNRDASPLPYFHWVREKGSAAFYIPDWRELPEEYFISRHGFFRSPLANNAASRLWRRLRGEFTAFRRLAERVPRLWRQRD